MANKILKYPLKAPEAGEYLNSSDGPTGRIDYLRVQRFRVDYTKSPSGYGGSNLPGNNVSTVLDDRIAYVAMPPSISTSYAGNYDQINMGGAGVLGAQIASSIVNNNGNADQITSAIQAASSTAFPEMGFNKGATAIQSLSSVLGLETGVTGKALQQLTQGQIMNPFTEQIYNGVPFRNHSFNFKMFARNQKEAQEILQIITYLKTGTLPKLGDGNNNSAAINSAGRFLRVPDKYLLEFVRLDPASNTLSKLNHYKFQPCVCTNVVVNYTPDGQYVSFKDAISDLSTDGNGNLNQILVPAVEVSLQFAETRILTQSDAEAGY